MSKSALVCHGPLVIRISVFLRISSLVIWIWEAREGAFLASATLRLACLAVRCRDLSQQLP
jgi:hypothetical protein